MKDKSHLDSEQRLGILQPEQTLRRIGLKEGDVLCDIGAGTGVFTVPAAKMTTNTIYALDVDQEMLDIIAGKAAKEKLTNIELLKVTEDDTGIARESLDIALMSTVLHHIEDQPKYLQKVRDMLKPNGTVAIIEFHKRETEKGPSLDRKIASESLAELLGMIRFNVTEIFDLGSDLYCIVAKKNG